MPTVLKHPFATFCIDLTSKATLYLVIHACTKGKMHLNCVFTVKLVVMDNGWDMDQKP